jgi:outer membrane protein OmpA-like peptidoglycan-associated protein
MVIREKSSKTNGNRKSTHPDVGVRLAKIDVEHMDNTVVLLNLNLQFEGDAPVVTSASVKEINDLVDFLQKNRSLDAFIRGHVCCGDEMPLSKKRAKTVYTELVRRGINPTRLRYQGFSNTIPAVFPEKTELDRSKNRRVDIIFSKTGRSNDPDPTEIAKSDASNSKDAIFSSESSILIETDGSDNLEFKTNGATQEQIDNILVKETSKSSKSSKKESIDMASKLRNINISNLNHTVSLVIMSLEFEGIEPILTESTLKEINDIYTFLSQNSQINAFIRGHVCCGDNYKLSKKRAKYVYDELKKRGISATRLRYEGFSNTLLLVNPERTELDRAKNRRVDIIFSVKSK